jgi:hypothetical protein
MKAFIPVLLSLTIVAASPAKCAIEVATSQTKSFQSPMVLTVDFPVTESSRWGQGEWLRGSDYASLPGYVCDNVSIKNMQVSFEPSKNGKVRVIVKGILAASEGHDKSVDLNLDLITSDIVVGSATEEGIKVEEEKEEKWKAHMEVSPLALSATPGPKLRISMAVEDN